MHIKRTQTNELFSVILLIYLAIAERHLKYFVHIAEKHYEQIYEDCLTHSNHYIPIQLQCLHKVACINGHDTLRMAIEWWEKDEIEKRCRKIRNGRQTDQTRRLAKY